MNVMTQTSEQSQHPAAAPQSSGGQQKSPQQGRQQNQKQPRRPVEMTDAENQLLRTLIDDKLKNPFAARELLHALRQGTGSRFVAMSNALTNQAFRVLQDTDRVLSELTRRSVTSPEALTARFGHEQRVADVLTQLVYVTAEMANAVIAATPKSPDKRRGPRLVMERSVMDRMHAIGDKSATSGSTASVTAEAPSA